MDGHVGRQKECYMAQMTRSWDSFKAHIRVVMSRTSKDLTREQIADRVGYDVTTVQTALDELRSTRDVVWNFNGTWSLAEGR